MEGRMIVVKNLPSCSQDTIENYLEVVCDNGVQHIQFYNERVKHIAMVTMEEDIEDFESCQKRSGKRKLEDNRVELLAVAPPNGVLVTGLPPEITQDTIRYYFENKRSGGEDEAVEDCKYHMNLGLATVVFRNKDVVQRVLNVTSHIPIKKKPPVTVQPYYPEFHAEVLDFLVDLDPCDTSSGGDNSPVNDNLEKKPQDSTSVYEEDTMKSVVSAQSIKERIGMFEEQRIQAASGPQCMVSIYRRPEPERVENNSMVSICGQSEEILSMQSVCVAQEADRREEVTERKVIEEPMQIKETPQTCANPLPQKPAPKPRTQTNSHALHLVEDKIDLPLANVKLLKESQNVDREFPKCQITYDIYSGAVNISGPEDELQMLKIRLYEESNSLTCASNPGPQHVGNVKQEPAPEPEVKERVEKTTVKFASINVRLLETSHKVDTEFPMCKLTYKTDSGTIDMEGPETKLQEAKLLLYTENHQISSTLLPVPQTIADILKTEKGRTYLDKEVKGHSSVWYLDGNTIHCASFTTSDTDNMIGQVKRLILQEYISYNESHFHFLNSSAWTDLKDMLEKNHMVRIVCDRGKCQVRIDGLDEDVNVSKKQIEKELKSHSHQSGAFALSGAKAKCLKNLFVQDIDGLKKAISGGGGHWNDSGNMNSFNVKFDGDPEVVKKVGMALKHIVEKKVWHERLVLGKDVAKEKDLNLLIRGLHRTNLKAFQAAFEAEHSVFLELNLPGVKKEHDMSTAAFSTDQSTVSKRREEQNFLPRTRSLEDVNSDSETEELAIFPRFRQTIQRPSPQRYSPRQLSPPRKPLSTSMTVGNITIFVKKGDISKEKADVLVNVVPKNWDVTATAVSQAFVKAGGEEFKQQITTQKRQMDVMSMFNKAALLQAKHGTQGTPPRIIQTKSCGNQSGKMIYTIALDKWNPPGSKTELKNLIDNCLKTAANNGYSSIALTSFGCGKLFHFPEKFVASCLVTAVKTNSKLPNLKQVSMVLFDHSTYQIFLNEINPGNASRPSTGSRAFRHSRSYADFGPPDESPPPSDSITVGSTNITVQQGDITKIKATVLVNVVTEDLDLESTAVSKAFARAGGRALVQDFEDQKNSPATNNIIVTSGGQLKCQYVYHVVLKNWHPSTEKKYQDVVRDCFKLAGGYNTPSIAFPSLGCGVLFKYPTDFVVSCLLAEAKSASIANVVFVIYDRPVLHAFLQELGTFGGDDDNGSENMDILRKYAKASKTDRVPSSDNKSANIVIYGANQPMCVAAKKALSKKLSDDFLYVQIIKNENLTRLTGKQLDSLKRHADKSGIWIKFPDPDKKKNKDRPELKLKGEKNSVLFVKSQAQDILMTVVKTVQKPLRRASGTRGSRQFLLEMGQMSDFPSPSYWTHFKPKHPLQEILSGFLSKFTGPKQVSTYKLVPVDTATFNAIDKLVQLTWDSTIVGHGKDAVGLNHQTLKVKKVERLEHPEMYRRYCQKRSSRFSDACSSGGPFTAIDKLPGSKSAVRTTKIASSVLQHEVYQEVNEHYFFHGTKPANLQAILTQGLDSRVGNTQAMFGSGVYGAESSTKADQYTDDKTQRTPGDKQMVLMRMTLGHPYICNSPKKYCRPPCRDLGHLDDKCNKTHGFFHSVVGDGQWLFREFVVYEPDLCYPEYVITYARM